MTGGSSALTPGAGRQRGIALEVGDGTVLVISSLPAAVGEVALAAEPLRHGLVNAATRGIWRFRGPAGSAILKVANLPAATEPPKADRSRLSAPTP
jgi:hypothetical protein